MTYDADVIVIGAGGGGPVVAKELGEMGLKVLVLEAGPWFGNKQWPAPDRDSGGTGSSSYDDLDANLLRKYLNKYEENMNDIVSGSFRFGPADRSRPPWFRNLSKNALVWQIAGVGGTTLHYLANSPRAFSSAVDNVWPISYRELIPYYEKVEATLPVLPAPTTAKEELFYYGARKAGWPLLRTLNPVTPGYRPQPNAILHPDERLKDPNYPDEKFSNVTGCTLCGHCMNGCPHPYGQPIDKLAKRTTLVSYVPLALKTGNVEIRPNTFVTKILTENSPSSEIQAVGVKIRNTWSGEKGKLFAKAIVMSAGTVESPRLWLNSNLPYNPWVGRGLTTHWFDWIAGVFDEKELFKILGSPNVNPHVGQNSAARFDYPGLGSFETFGISPGLFANVTYTFSGGGFQGFGTPEKDVPWGIRGRVIGADLKELMANYLQTLSVIILTDDEANPNNYVSVDPNRKDEHGPVPIIRYVPSKRDSQKRDQLARIAADLMLKAGAKKVIRTDWPPLYLHIQSTMRIGYVIDSSCEAFQVKRLFIADNSALYNGIGGPNPTLTTQTLATRTAEKLANRYFSG